MKRFNILLLFVFFVSFFLNGQSYPVIGIDTTKVLYFDNSTIIGTGEIGNRYKVDTALLATQYDISILSSDNIYNSNGTFTSTRTVTTNGLDLKYIGNGNFSFGTATPLAKFHLVTDGVSTGKSFFIENSNGDDNFTILDNGNIGFNTATPAATLSVDGSTLFTNTSGEPSLFIGKGGNVSNAAAMNFVENETGSFQYGWRFRLDGSQNEFYLESNNGTVASPDIYTQIGFKREGVGVGIGIETPTQELHVVGNARVTGSFYDSNNSAGTSDQVLSTTGTGTAWVDNSNIYSSDGTLTSDRTITSTGQKLEYSALDGNDINVTTFNDHGNTFALTDAGSGAVSNLSHRPEYLKLTSSPFQIVSSNNDQLYITDTESNNATKTGSILTNHYTNIEEPFLWLRAQSGSSFNTLRFGGGDSGANAATVIDFHTASNNTTTTGTRRMRIDNAGTVNFSEFIEIDARSTVPSSPQTGTVYMDDGTNTGGTPTLRYYNGTSWVNM